LAFSATFSKSVLRVIKKVIMNDALLLKGETEEADKKLENIEQFYHVAKKDKLDLMIKLVSAFREKSD